jgi:hypothetical protein
LAKKAAGPGFNFSRPDFTWLRRSESATPPALALPLAHARDVGAEAASEARGARPNPAASAIDTAVVKLLRLRDMLALQGFVQFIKLHVAERAEIALIERQLHFRCCVSLEHFRLSHVLRAHALARAAQMRALFNSGWSWFRAAPGFCMAP